MGTPKLSDDPRKVGWNVNAEKLHCLIVMEDSFADALTHGRADGAFFRAFVIEDRETSEIYVKMRFRYKDGDSWSQLKNPKLAKEDKTVKEIVRWMSNSIEDAQRLGLKVFAGGIEPPEKASVCFYPPNPDDSEATLNWLVAQDLIEVKKVQ